MSIYIAVGVVQVKRFDHEGFYQLQKKTLVVETFYWNRTYSYVNAHQRFINMFMLSFLITVLCTLLHIVLLHIPSRR